MRTVTSERQKVLTDSSDNSGCKDNSIWPVPVVEGLASSYGDSLACSIRHHLSTKKVEDHIWVQALNSDSLKEKLIDANGCYQLALKSPIWLR